MCLPVKESFYCKTRQDSSINCHVTESLCLEITNRKSKNVILNLTYRPLNGNVKEFETHLNEILSVNEVLKKEIIMAGDFKMNLLDFGQNKKVQNLLNIMFGHSMMPVINEPPRVTKNTATAIDHIFINSVTTTKFKTGIIKSDISIHFPIFFMEDYNVHIKEIKETKNVSTLDAIILIFPWKNSNANCALLAGTVSQTYLIQIRHMITSMKFLAHFMTSVSQKRKLNENLKNTMISG